MASIAFTHAAPCAAPAAPPAAAGWPVRLARALHRAACLHAQRRALARLDADRLADIGLTRDQARAEAARPVWDAPAHWRG